MYFLKYLTVFITLVTFMSVDVYSQGLPSAADTPKDGEEVKGNTRVAEIHEVEKGFYFSVDLGANYMLGLTSLGLNNFAPINESWLQPGTRLGTHMGYDITDNWDFEAFMVAHFNRGIVQPDLIRDGQITGDLVQIAPGLATKFSVYNTKRLYVYGRLGLGAAIWLPPSMVPTSITNSKNFALGLYSEGSLGVEYYSLLRHISVGIEAGFVADVLPFAFGFQIMPQLKYTF